MKLLKQSENTIELFKNALIYVIECESKDIFGETKKETFFGSNRSGVLNSCYSKTYLKEGIVINYKIYEFNYSIEVFNNILKNEFLSIKINENINYICEQDNFLEFMKEKLPHHNELKKLEKITNKRIKNKKNNRIIKQNTIIV